jgi:hypothetical protein
MAVLIPPDPKFDRFLHAVVFEQNDLSLSVLTTLAREGIDPWQEAARLAALPIDEAINNLTTTIWRSNGGTISAEQAHARASQLIQRLPAADDTVYRHPVPTEADLLVIWLTYGLFVGLVAITGNISTTPNRQSHQTARTVSIQGAEMSQPGPTIRPIR